MASIISRTAGMAGCRMFLAMILVAGCAHYQPQPLQPGKTAAQFESRRLDSPGLRRFLEQNPAWHSNEWPVQKWDMNSLTLAAFYFHPDLAVARAQWRLAEAGIETAGARPNPSVTVNPAYDSQIPGTPSPWIVPVSLDIPIETAGKRKLRQAEARESSKSAYWSLINAAWQIRSGVRTALLELSMADRRLAVQTDQTSVQEKYTALLKQRYEVGGISRPELLTAQIAFDKARLDLADARAKDVQAHSHLAGALGVSAQALDGLQIDFNFPTDAGTLTTAEARRAALLGRSDILGALADYEAAQENLRLQIAKQYPDLHLGPGYAWNSGNAADNQWSLGLTLDLPILDQNQGPIAEAKARRELAAAKFLQLQAQVIAQVDRAVAGWTIAAEQMKAGESLFAGEQKQRESLSAQLAAGAIDRTDATAGEIEFNAARLAQLDNESHLQAALGALEDALQQPVDHFDALKALPVKPVAEKSKP